MSAEFQSVIGVVGCALVPVVAAWLIVTIRKMNALWPDTAKKFGVVFTKSKDQKSLEGVISGVPIRAFEFSKRAGNTTTSGTRVLGRALVPTQRQFSMQIERAGAGGALYHVVNTGDPAFDATLVLKSEKADDVRALLDPTLRGALLWLTREANLTYDRGELCLALGGTPSNKQELEALIRVVIAAASARLS